MSDRTIAPVEYKVSTKPLASEVRLTADLIRKALAPFKVAVKRTALLDTVARANGIDGWHQARKLPTPANFNRPVFQTRACTAVSDSEWLPLDITVYRGSNGISALAAASSSRRDILEMSAEAGRAAAEQIIANTNARVFFKGEADCLSMAIVASPGSGGINFYMDRVLPRRRLLSMKSRAEVHVGGFPISEEVPGNGAVQFPVEDLNVNLLDPWGLPARLHETFIASVLAERVMASSLEAWPRYLPSLIQRVASILKKTGSVETARETLQAEGIAGAGWPGLVDLVLDDMHKQGLFTNVGRHLAPEKINYVTAAVTQKIPAWRSMALLMRFVGLLHQSPGERPLLSLRNVTQLGLARADFELVRRHAFDHAVFAELAAPFMSSGNSLWPVAAGEELLLFASASQADAEPLLQDVETRALGDVWMQERPRGAFVRARRDESGRWEAPQEGAHHGLGRRNEDSRPASP